MLKNWSDTNMKPIQIIKAPSILGLRPTGVEHAADAFLGEGFLKEHVKENQILTVLDLNHKYSAKRKENGVLNEEALNEFSNGLLESVLSVKNQNKFPVVLGGDCSILLGIMPALKLVDSQSGLITLDGHADFYYPQESTTGEAADMDIALVSGRGPDSLVNIRGQKPYVKDEHIIHIGQRDEDETVEYGSHQIQETTINHFPLQSIRKSGIEKTNEVIENLINNSRVKEYWVHFDTDVINDKENPAVDYRLSGGLTFEECKRILSRIVQSHQVAGLSIGIYNPTLDKGRMVCKKLVNMFEEILSAE